MLRAFAIATLASVATARVQDGPAVEGAWVREQFDATRFVPSNGAMVLTSPAEPREVVVSFDFAAPIDDAPFFESNATTAAIEAPAGTVEAFGFLDRLRSMFSW